MKRSIIFSLFAILLLGSCSKEKDLYGESAGVQRKDIVENVFTVFGEKFPESQDWSMLRNGLVTIAADAPDFTPVKVQVLTGFPTQYGTAEVLNETTVEAGERVVLNYDAPDGLDTLFAACVNEKGQYRAVAFALGDAEVSFAERAAAAGARARRAQDVEPAIIGEGVPSDNARMVATGHSKWAGSHWNDKLYDTKLKCEVVADYNANERQTMNAIIQANVPEYSNNTSRIKASDIYINTSNYFTTTGQKEITIAPVACGAWFCGWEQLYYYYFNPSKVEGMTEAERTAYLQGLPKFKIAEMAETFANTKLQTIEEKINDSRTYYQYMLNRINRTHVYTLAYFGDEDKLDQHTPAFPAGYQIGIMLRIDSLQDQAPVYNCVTKNIAGGEKVGSVNLYADRLLNDEVNDYAGWKNANLGKGMSRAAIFGANGKNYVGFEDLNDDDFNDIVFEVEGGVEIIDESLLLDRKVYTMAFEDTKLGDYDLNDVVIKAQRQDLTHVKFSLEASGANDDLYLRNINGKILNTTTEVHDIFGLKGGRGFVNTVAGQQHVDAVQEVMEVPVGFTFTNDSYLPYIYNKSKGYEIRLSRSGEDPHGIIIPCDFRYPKEKVCVGGKNETTVAYKEFNSWGKGKVDAKAWYLTPNENQVYTLSVFK